MSKNKPRKPKGVAIMALIAAVVAAALVPFYLQQSSRKAAPAPSPPLERTSGECADRSEMCDAWHKARMCDHFNVQALCKRVCGLCPGVPGRVPPVPREEACRRDNHSAAVPDGALDRLFQRVMSDFPQYEPVALSTDPWVVQLENFISDEEAAAFVSTCEQQFERSLAEDVVKPMRTSHQCWCNFAGCFTNEKVNTISRRIANVTGTAPSNGEDMQVVRYERGQFYRVHHDQNTAVWAPQGPRVLTFFMYLNTPEAGGGTRFPAINGGITVQARTGRALIWPSVRNMQSMEVDGRTRHEALPVEEGIKFGANMWIHQFDYKTPYERECKLTFVNTDPRGRGPRTDEHARLVQGLVPTYGETVAAAKLQGESQLSQA